MKITLKIVIIMNMMIMRTNMMMSTRGSWSWISRLWLRWSWWSQWWLCALRPARVEGEYAWAQQKLPQVWQLSLIIIAHNYRAQLSRLFDDNLNDQNYFHKIRMMIMMKILLINMWFDNDFDNIVPDQRHQLEVRSRRGQRSQIGQIAPMAQRTLQEGCFFRWDQPWKCSCLW